MKQLIVVGFLLLSTTSAWAEWTLVASNDKSVTYADLGTIRKTGNLVKMWGLSDYKTIQIAPTGLALLSLKSQYEYDCDGERHRMLYFSWHSGNMGGGDVVYDDANPLKWQPVAPESIGEALWKMACKQ